MPDHKNICNDEHQLPPMADIMDWDDDFGGAFHVPPSVASASSRVVSEAAAARELAGVISRLRLLLLSRTEFSLSSAKTAVALVASSTPDRSDDFFKSPAWAKFGEHHEVPAGTFEEVLKRARACLAELEEEVVSK